jgi:hypothetical protein
VVDLRSLLSAEYAASAITIPDLAVDGRAQLPGGLVVAASQEVRDSRTDRFLDVGLADPAVAGDATPVPDRLGRLGAQL